MGTATIETAQPAQVIMQMMTGHWISQSLYAAAKLGVADYLEGKTLSIHALAEALDARPDYLYRLMRALASINLFEEKEGQSFSLTPVGELLRSNHENSLRPVILMLGEENYKAWGYLFQSMQAKKAPFELAFGKQAYEYFQANPESGQIFNAAMAALVRQDQAIIAEIYDFSQFSTVVDVGGGSGMLLASILHRHPSVSGILFELPQVVDEAHALLRQQGLTARCQVVAGDFFQAVVEGGDAYVLSHIVHTFDDALIQQILDNVHQAMPEHGKLLIIESILEPGNNPATAKNKFMDLNMLVLTPGGREHTQAEFSQLLKQSDFELTNIYPTASGTAIIEALKR